MHKKFIFNSLKKKKKTLVPISSYLHCIYIQIEQNKIDRPWKKYIGWSMKIKPATTIVLLKNYPNPKQKV